MQIAESTHRGCGKRWDLAHNFPRRNERTKSFLVRKSVTRTEGTSASSS